MSGRTGNCPYQNKLAGPGLAADLRHRNPVTALLQDERLLGVRKLRSLHRPSLLPAREPVRKTLAKNGPVCRPQIRRWTGKVHGRAGYRSVEGA